MIEVMQTHWISALVIVFAIVSTPFFWSIILPHHKALQMGWITSILASLSCVVVLYNIIPHIGPQANLLIGLMWLIPPLIVWTYRTYFQSLHQRYLISLQIFRMIGGVFLLEMARGNIPASFAVPAGIGDILVAFLALYVFLQKETPRWGVIAVLTLGILDFVLALLFSIGFNELLLFPIGLIPIFFVPYAITYHMISFINLIERNR